MKLLRCLDIRSWWKAFLSIIAWVALGHSLYFDGKTFPLETGAVGLIYVGCLSLCLSRWPTAHVWDNISRSLRRWLGLSLIVISVTTILLIFTGSGGEHLVTWNTILVVLWQLSRLLLVLMIAMVIPLWDHPKE
jgi:hypothetical protein